MRSLRRTPKVVHVVAPDDPVVDLRAELDDAVVAVESGGELAWLRVRPVHTLGAGPAANKKPVADALL